LLNAVVMFLKQTAMAVTSAPMVKVGRLTSDAGVEQTK
jgi:hypothetical protein